MGQLESEDAIYAILGRCRRINWYGTRLCQCQLVKNCLWLRLPNVLSSEKWRFDVVPGLAQVGGYHAGNEPTVVVAKVNAFRKNAYGSMWKA